MIRLGRVFHGQMVEMRARNAKLARRAIAMVKHLARCDDQTAKNALAMAGGDLKLAILMARGIDVETGRALLSRSSGHLRAALAEYEAKGE